MPVTIIHENIKRCLLSDAGVVNAYLDSNNSHNLEGVSPTISGTAGAGTSGLTLKHSGAFSSGVQAGQYVKNVTTGYYHKILSVADADTLTLHFALDSAQTNWGKTTSTTANKLVDSGADFVSAGIAAGMIAALRNLSNHAIVTNVDSATTLSVDSDIFPVDTNYTLMSGFSVGDEYEVQTAVLDGSEGQVMVEIPKYYYNYAFTDDKHSWLLSVVPLRDFIVHPAFKRPDGTERDFIYYSAFEGVIDDLGFANGTVLTGYNLAEAKLKSLPGMYPVVNGQRSEFRTVADNNNDGGVTGWHQLDWYTLWAVQLLMMVELESMDSQSVLGVGMTQWSSAQRDDWVVNTNNRAVVHTGYSLRNGNNSANVNTAAQHAGGYLTYRGIENPYGQIWKWVDGINIEDHRVFLANDHENYADDSKASPYVDTGIFQPDANGYISKVHATRHGLLVKESSGSGSTFIPDYYYQNTGWRVVRSGGFVDFGDFAGFASLSANLDSSFRSSIVGGRVCFRA